MSYHGIGWVDVGSASGSGLNCIDGKPVGRNNKCCPLGELYNRTWIVLAGKNAHRYFCEAKVRDLLEQMVERTKTGSIFKEGVGAAKVEPEMQKGISRALQNFNAIYPAARWHKRPGPAEEHCVYDKYVPDPTDPSWPGYASTLQFVTSALPASERTAGHWALKDPAQALIYSVPGGNLSDNRVGFRPTLNAGLTVKSGDGGNVVQLTPWATAFVDRMAPGWKGLTLPKQAIRMMRAAVDPGPVEIPKDAIKRQAVDAGGDDESGFPWLLAGGAVVLIGGGAAVWYATRKGN